MTSLAELQRTVQAHVLDGATRPAASLIAGERDAASERLGIYTHAYAARLSEALAVAYPKLRLAIGAESFAELCARFVRYEPSVYRSVRYYGREFAAFVRARYRGVKGAGLQELAHWEWATASAFDAPDVTWPLPVDLSAIAPDEWPTLRLAFAPSLQRIRLVTNSMAWVRAGDALPRRWCHAAATEWVLWRRDLTVYFRSLAADEAHLLDRAVEGVPFGGLCEALLTMPDMSADSAALRAATLLRGWQQDQLLIGAS